MAARQPNRAPLSGIEGLVRDWTFSPSQPGLRTILRRMLYRPRRGPAPAFEALVPIAETAQRWIAYFVYLPDGQGLSPAHAFTLDRLAGGDAKLLVVCSTPDPAQVPGELHEKADALYWKATDGFDFSAYALALGEIARHSPGSDAFVMNDSVFGPFVPVDTLWPSLRWDLTGLTASFQIENHVQSYAFGLRDVTPARLDALSGVMDRRHAFDDYRPVVYLQETRLARIAARSMSVGAMWYGPRAVTIDPSLFAAIPLLRAGFPFLKRGLLTKHVGIYGETAIRGVLEDLRHPV